MSAAASETVTFYTRGRRFPLMFGKWSDGTRIPGGPYTSIQALGGAGSLFLLWQTMGVWGHFGLLNAAILLGVPFGLTLFLRHVPLGGRNPFLLVFGLATALAQPGSGTLHGRPVRLPRTVRMSSRVAIQLPAPPEARAPLGCDLPLAHPVRPEVRQQPNAPAHPRPAVMTGVARLRARAANPAQPPESSHA